jgi:hypothetical protein
MIRFISSPCSHGYRRGFFSGVQASRVWDCPQSASSPEFKNEWPSSLAFLLSFNCMFTDNWLCEWPHRVQLVWRSLCQRCVLWFARWKSCGVTFPVPFRPLWFTRPRSWDILLTRSMLCSWLCVFRVIFVLPFQFDRFYEVFLGAIYYTFQHVFYAFFFIIPMSCYTFHNMLFMWRHTSFLCGLISGLFIYGIFNQLHVILLTL